MNSRSLVSLLLGLSVAATALAQPHERSENRGRDREHGPRVILYEHADYRGDSLALYPGDALDNLSGLTFEGGRSLNDRISSIRIEGGAELYVYEHAHYRGQAMRVTESVRDLAGRLLADSVSASWNDRISSLRVASRERGPGGGRRGDPDSIIRSAYHDLLGREPDAAGLRQFRSLIIDQGWTERMVRDQIRQSDEFRREGADGIIRRAYRDVLGREPDPSGLKHYREALLEKNWTENDVRDALRRSDEYRRKAHGG